MKKSFIIIFLFSVYHPSNSQNIVYDNQGNKKYFLSEEININFSNSGIALPLEIEPNIQISFISMLPTIIDLGFQITSSALNNRNKKFSADYSKQKSNLEAGSNKIPDFVFTRMLDFDGSDSINLKALEISFRATKIEDLDGFSYYIEYINLSFSAAKSRKRNNTFDYLIEIKPTLLINGEKKVQNLSPIVVSSLSYKENKFIPNEHRTDIIPFSKGAALTEISIKIIESNPAKVRAEKILSLWNDNMSNIKTIVNHIILKEEN